MTIREIVRYCTFTGVFWCTRAKTTSNKNLQTARGADVKDMLRTIKNWEGATNLTIPLFAERFSRIRS